MKAASVAKKCKTCGEFKPLDEFHRFKKYDRPGQPVYFSSSCKSCRSEDARQRRYGTTLLDQIEKQGNLCALCQVEAPTCLDHDHTTDILRGAVCRRCNFALHYLDDPEWQARTEKFLKRGRKRR